MINKKIFLSILIVGTIASMAGAGTWAAFTDTGTSTANTFTAGTLDLTLNGLNTITGFGIGPVAPKATGTAGSIVVRNAGTIDGNLVVSATAIQNLENGRNAPELLVDNSNDLGELGGAVTITIKDHAAASGVPPLYSGLVSGLSSSSLGSLPANTEKTLDITYAISDVGNEIQTDSLSFNMVFTLTQV
jgi:spore coat-associated protein N